MVTPLVPPQLVINQRFAGRPVSTARRTRALLFGPLAQVVRYSESAEKDLGLLGNFDPTAVGETVYSWPNLISGNILDKSFVKLYVDSGLFRYFQDNSGTAVLQSQRNLVRLPGKIVASNGFGTASFIDGGVARGDAVHITGVDQTSAPFELLTYVIGSSGDLIASTTGLPVAAASNIAAQAASNSENAVLATQLNIAADETAYIGDIAGYPNETYTIRCVVGGAPGVAILSVTSASNTDNNASLTSVALGSALALTTRGGAVTFSANGAVTTFTAGQTWTVSMSQAVSARNLVVSGTYAGTANRTYIVEVTRGGDVASGTAQVRVSSQDGTDSGAIQLISSLGDFTLGSFGLAGNFAPANRLVRGDKWTVAVTASAEGTKRTLILADELPNNVALNASAALNLTFYRKKSVEISAESTSVGVFNYIAEPTQIRVSSSVVMTFADLTLAGNPINASLWASTVRPDYSKLYVTYRAWYPSGTAVTEINSRTDLGDALPGPSDVVNPLKEAARLTRLTCGGESVFVYIIGDPSDKQNWEDAFERAGQSQAVYSYVPLTTDKDILISAAAATATANDPSRSSYRVLWASCAREDGAAVLDATKTSDSQIALAVCEDNALASGTQWTQVRLLGTNADLQTLGIRVGDYLRYGYEIDAWGKEVYQQRKITEVRSAKTVIVDSQLFQETVGRRVEIHRVFNAAELSQHYGDQAAAYAADTTRFVLAPDITVGGQVLPGYYAAAMVAGLRSNLLPQAPLSTQVVPGISAVGGLGILTVNDLNILAARGCMIISYDQLDQVVKVRHGVTTGDTTILAKREESMVTARHVALFAIADRLRPYAGRINISDDSDAMEVLKSQLRADLNSVRDSLRNQGNTAELGGLIVDLIITSIQPSALQADELEIEGELVLGRPGNSIKFNCTVR